MRFTFLGTSAGLPTPERNVTALALTLEQQRGWYLIDCGEGTQHRLLRTPYSAAKVRAIFITHVHGDHCYGLPGLIASAAMGRRKEPLTICAPAGIEEFIAAVRRYTDLNQLSYELRFMRSDSDDFIYDDGDMRVDSVALSHRVPSFAFRFEEIVHDRALDPERLAALGVPRGELWGELQHGRAVALDDGRTVQPAQACKPQRAPRRIVVGGDNDRPELLADALTGCDVLIHEATFTEDVLAKVGPHYQHSTPAQVARTAQLARVPHLVLTHFSQRYRRVRHGDGYAIIDLFDEARRHYSGDLHLAEDLASYELTRDRQLLAAQ